MGNFCSPRWFCLLLCWVLRSWIRVFFQFWKQNLGKATLIRSSHMDDNIYKIFLFNCWVWLYFWNSLLVLLYKNNIVLVWWSGKDILKNTVQCMIYVENAVMEKFWTVLMVPHLWRYIIKLLASPWDILIRSEESLFLFIFLESNF